MSCELFVPEVRGSRNCSVCRRTLREHQPAAIYVEPRKIFSKNSTPLPPTSPIGMSLATSHNSAFSPYARPVTTQTAQPPPLLRPQPRLAVPELHSPLSQEDRSDSCIYKKIRGKRKERSSSVGDIRSSSPPPPQEEHSASRRWSPVPSERSADFKKILQRFQSADQPPTPSTKSQSPPPLEIPMSPTATRELWSPIRSIRDVWSPAQPPVQNDNWSPSQRSSGGFRSSPISRNTSLRSRLSISSPLSFLPTRECSPRSAPSPSLIPLRVSGSSSEEGELTGHSPLSHTGSTPEPMRMKPITPVVPTPKRRSLPGRWVKETDIDEPNSLPPMSPPIGSPLHVMSQENIAKSIDGELKAKAVRELLEKGRMLIQGRVGGSCRRVLSGLDHNSNPSPSGVYVRRSRSKDERPHHASQNRSIGGSTGSVTAMYNIPIYMSSESVRDSPRDSANSSDVEASKQYQQISLAHVQTLSMVADRLAEEMRRGEEPVSRNRLSSLDFSHFVVSPQPALTKGKSLFYNAILPRHNNTDYPVTLMIAPCSQYAPLMRHGDSQLFAAPSFLEMEDHDGSIRRFLEDTGTHNLDGRNTKVIAMPRLNLCSFHSLAAHYLSERMERSTHEELVCFIMLQLLAALKMLQSDGVEALSANFKEFLLAYRYLPVDSQPPMREFPRLIFLPETLGAEVEAGGDELVGLCRYALRALCTLLNHRMDGRPPPMRLRSRFSRPLLACANLLSEDKSSSLTKAKNVLELALWWTGEPPRVEAGCRRSIDLARAECVDSLLRQLICEPGCRLGPRERLKIEFLLSATPRSLIDSQNATLAAAIN